MSRDGAVRTGAAEPDTPAEETRPQDTTEQQARFYGAPALSDGTVSLRPATGEHAAELYALLKDAETLLLTGSAHSAERAEAVMTGDVEPWGTPEKLEEVYEAWSVAEDRVVWVIVVDGAVVGELLLMDLDAPNLSCGLRLWITGARDRGVGTAAMTMALDYAFRTAALHRVSLEVFDHNPRARHVYEKLGFRLEGTLREALWQDGRWIDAHVMGILRREWLGEEA